MKPIFLLTLLLFPLSLRAASEEDRRKQELFKRMQNLVKTYTNNLWYKTADSRRIDFTENFLKSQAQGMEANSEEILEA